MLYIYICIYISISQIERNWRDRLQATCTRDPTIRTQCQQVKRCTEIALDCMHIDRKKRPDIANIILKLNETEMAIDKLRKDNMTTSVDKVNKAIHSFFEIYCLHFHQLELLSEWCMQCNMVSEPIDVEFRIQNK